MAVQVELWKPEIIEFLAKDNQFFNYCVSADEYVLQGKVVHIPQSGGAAAVERNRSILPAVIVKRADTDITYSLDEYTTDPVLIPNADVAELSYDKRMSVVRENMGNLKEVAMDNLLHLWSQNIPTASKIKTTGSSTHTATAPGGTGTRKNLLNADLRSAQKLLNNQNVAKDGRYVILTGDMLDQLLADLTAAQLYAFKDTANVENGAVGRLWGFSILERSTCTVFDTSDAIKLPEAAGATTDNIGCIFWQRDMVERALGTINMFEQIGAPEYYGDIYSFLVRLGGRNRRTDNKGIGVILADA